MGSMLNQLNNIPAYVKVMCNLYKSYVTCDEMPRFAMCLSILESPPKKILIFSESAVVSASGAPTNLFVDRDPLHHVFNYVNLVAV